MGRGGFNPSPSSDGGGRGRGRGYGGGRGDFVHKVAQSPPVKPSRGGQERDEDTLEGNLPTAPPRILTDAEKQDVEKWKEERRRHFPTSANIARRKALREQNNEAGALMPNSSLKRSREGKGSESSRGEDACDPRGLEKGDEVKHRRMERLREILEKQKAMGLDKAAGTTEMLMELRTSEHKGADVRRGDEDAGEGSKVRLNPLQQQQQTQEERRQFFEKQRRRKPLLDMLLESEIRRDHR